MSEQEVPEITEETPPEKEEKGSTEYTEFPDERTEKRFKKVYWNMKQSEKAVETLAQQNRALVERLDSLTEKQKQKEVGDQTSSLREAEKNALENGDYEGAVKARDQITDLKLAAKEKPQIEQEQWLTPDKERQIGAWASETDENDEPLRPWCDEGHEDFEMARDLTILYAEKNPNAELSEILAAVDKRMGRVSKPKSRQSNVLANAGSVRPKTAKKANLSEDEKFVAKKQYPNDPKALEKYAAAKEKYL